MNFMQALENATAGMPVCRAGWDDSTARIIFEDYQFLYLYEDEDGVHEISATRVNFMREKSMLENDWCVYKPQMDEVKAFRALLAGKKMRRDSWPNEGFSLQLVQSGGKDLYGLDDSDIAGKTDWVVFE